MNVEKELLLNLIKEFAHEYLLKNPGTHDWDHTLRVKENASRIIANTSEKVDDFIVFAAVYLHDIARAEDTSHGKKKCHAQRGGEIVAEYLPTIILEETVVAQIVHAVTAHRYRQKNPNNYPQTIEAKILYDADKLDGLGAIGIGRAFHFAGRLNARVHNDTNSALKSEEFSREDTAWREFLIKLQYVPQKMLTEYGREIAIQRVQFMKDFFHHLNQETEMNLEE